MDDIDTARRGLVAAVVGGAAAGGFFSPAASYLDRFAPLSGDVWEATTDSAPGSVDSDYGAATVQYDGHRVPEVTADDEQALYYAVGYAHGTDRLFQMDLQRRLMRGQLSAVVGERALESDRFRVQMDFARAADANWDALQSRNPEVAGILEAYTEGVNAAREDQALPPEFELLDYEPAPWTPADTLVLQLQISWTLTGSFETLRRARLRDQLGENYEELFPRRYDHDSPILRDEDGGRVAGRGTPSTGADAAVPDGDLTDWLSAFEAPDGVGSNSWVVGGEHTESGEPIVANDPHLSLLAPPVWYQQHLDWGDGWVRGVTFPGVPFVIIGENDAGAWGFTNAGADVLDCYAYEVDGDQYRYEGEWRDFRTEDHTIEVADGEDVTVTKRKTVHGPMVEREDRRVGVAWTGLSATATTDAIHAYAHSDGLEDFREATRDFDLPTQCVVYADREGNTYYKVTGRIPVRYTDGERVEGWRVFDGSAGEGEWPGYTPYGESSWDGFVPFEDKPGAVNPGYVATANQRIVDDPEYYLAESYSTPFRGERIYELLDAQTADGAVTPESMRDLQLDALDTRARRLVPRILEAADVDSAGAPFDALADWDYRMVADSEPALAFAAFVDAYREALYADAFDALGFDDGYWPTDWVTVHLADDSAWFDRDDTPESATAAMQSALDAASERIGEEGWETYGDYNVVSLDHPFDQSFLNYPRMPTDGSPATVNNYRRDAAVGSSWRMVVPMAGDAAVVLPGGNDGDPFSGQYHDQLRAWADGDYFAFDREFDGPSVDFGGGA
ncbi:penicillin acylase family protein [Halobacterium litoreum]|uniref:Penicillin acylase family protein n=1 Tax=Halobacterium litoreum TaxID=2039234 RepID=A0ABD5NIY2_9EURY|nr:penicillin acylase family protein [Halobacterium litoreum]UHH12295.1 penicillin acylase family protein [Halobacterium litoreum]